MNESVESVLFNESLKTTRNSPAFLRTGDCIHTLRSNRKGSSLCHNPFKGFTLLSESFEGLKGVGDQTTLSRRALLRHYAVSTRRRRHHATNLRKGSWEPEVSISCTLRNPSLQRALWSGQFWALRFGTTLQYDSHDCFHSEVPFGGRYIPFGTHRQFLERLSNSCGGSFQWNGETGLNQFTIQSESLGQLSCLTRSIDWSAFLTDTTGIL